MLTDSEISTFQNQLEHIQHTLRAASRKNPENRELLRAYNSLQGSLTLSQDFISVIEQVQLETIEKEKRVKDFKGFDKDDTGK